MRHSEDENCIGNYASVNRHEYLFIFLLSLAICMINNFWKQLPPDLYFLSRVVFLIRLYFAWQIWYLDIIQKQFLNRNSYKWYKVNVIRMLTIFLTHLYLSNVIFIIVYCHRNQTIWALKRNIFDVWVEIDR